MDATLLIGTRYTMEHGFYGDRMRRHGLEVVLPDEDAHAACQSIIFDELAAGKVVETSRTRLVRMIEAAKAQGADSVILGCTELGMILDTNALPLPAYDSTVIHCDSAVAFALG